MNKKMLIFSLAVNGYDWIYKDILETHEKYAAKIGADYALVNKPTMLKLGVESCWMKLFLIRRALENNYEQVLFVDADARIRDSAPDIRKLVREDKDIYFAKGYSGRINSGVILTRNTTKALRFFDQVIASMELTPPKESSVGWGENGHIIEMAKRFDNVGNLDHKWNNTYDPHTKDYIRHFSHGPLRNSNYRVLFHTPMMWLTRILRKADVFTQKQTIMELKQARLQSALQSVSLLYPEFSR